MLSFRLIFAFVVVFSLTFSPMVAFGNPPFDKINFDLSVISEEGLIGPPDGLRSLSYEFCLPKNEQYLAEVQAIAPRIQVYPNSRGRIGCNSGQYLCIGDTHEPGWREILLQLADLEYIEKINQSFAE